MKRHKRLICGYIMPIFLLIFIILLQVSQFFPLWSPSPSTPHSLRQAPHHCSCPRAIRISSLATPFPTLYFISSWLFCNYLLLLLNPLTLHSFPTTHSLLTTIKMFAISMILSLFLFAQLVFQIQLLIGMYLLPFYCSQFWSSFS